MSPQQDDPNKQPPPAAATKTKPIITIDIVPKEVTLSPGGQQQFHATVKGGVSGADYEVSWTVEPPAGAGTIGPRGLYTAPKTVVKPGGAKVVATSTADPTKSAIATVAF
jgi:hypothetical protein